ncbi:DUF1990 family protein [Streptomyces spirodelae]|uniref:DUF1990 domain-containing protein n=1 Tax=Streptomyces spirodelae TaxID=2812904 RepID=A0ABS3WZT7_9ACTN|nr:DUF1990 domain-containing protein [Streptomyces spirodelae]MBO8188589.1 DUF1990 domain-containing protein [Streptomyces spirodelae]
MTARPDFSYTPVGRTAHGVTPPAFRALCVHTWLGSGEAVFAAASRAVLEWRMHRAMGVRMVTDAERAAPGVRVTVGLGAGRLRVHGPCRVVWAVDGERRAGWAYGTLPGHPQCGEEAFWVEHAEDGRVRLSVWAYSRPAVWWTRAAGPVVPALQRLYAHRCGQVLRRLVRERPTGG